MKKLKLVFAIALSAILILMLGVLSANGQINFEGIVSQGEGIAGWNANGSGPEPMATGHQVPAPGFSSQYYYGSSHDYITQNPAHAAFHFLPSMTGFPLFEKALSDNGFTPDQVKVKFSLSTLGDDIEGLDWFFMNNWAYSNYYDNYLKIQLNEESMLACYFNYAQMYINTTSGDWLTETAYSQVRYNAAFSSQAVKDVAQAFLDDLNGAEIILKYESTYGSAFSGNGRSGAYYNVLNGTLEVGNPILPFQGLNSDHEGFAGWDADGTGLEPYGNGHLTQMYYGASLDYDNIDPDPSACLGHFLEGSTGFFNTGLQLQYRGFEIGDLKMKLGLESLGPDVQGEDWGYQNGYHWCNYYNNGGIIELNGEPILALMQDTNRLLASLSYWANATSIGKVYDISQNASPEAQFVAQSFLKDVGSHYLKTIGSNIQYHSLFNGNGRDGALYEIEEASLTGVHQQATFVPESSVSGEWTLNNSPYYIDGHLTIENGQTLTIQPGVKVAIRGPYHFDVQGNIIAEGTQDDNIIFTRSNPIVWWDGFDYNGNLTTNDSSLFDQCIFEYGLAQGGNEFNSGGIFAIKDYNDIKISNSTFRFNKVTLSDYGGGAIALWNSDPFISKCVFHNNSSDVGGAMLAYFQSDPIISNCLFYENEANSGGAICFWDVANGVLINSTIADNTATWGGGLYFAGDSDPQIINTILWGNIAQSASNQVRLSSVDSKPGFYYCNIEGGQDEFTGANFTGEYIFNLQDDPHFITMDEFSYVIHPDSPCLNNGTPDTSVWYYPQYLPETCICGNPRISDNHIDIGAYEQLLFNGIQIPVPETQTIAIQPNPVAHNAKILYELPANEVVIIELFNVLGQKLDELFNGLMPAGKHIIDYNATNLLKGPYILKMTAGKEVQTIKFIRY